MLDWAYLAQPLDLYCERVDQSFFSEPINALTNFAFVFLGIRLLLSEHKSTDYWYRFFSILVILIGLGSSLFHTFATRWSGWLDLLPIFFFLIFYIAYIFRKTLTNHFAVSIAFGICYYTAGLFVFDSLDGFLPRQLHIYFPAWLSFPIFILLLLIKKIDPRTFFLAWFIFTISLAARIVDLKWCEIWPLGTHFLWHICNAYSLYLLTKEIPRLESIEEHS